MTAEQQREIWAQLSLEECAILLALLPSPSPDQIQEIVGKARRAIREERSSKTEG